MFCAPTALRAIRREDPDGDFIADYDLSRLEGSSGSVLSHGQPSYRSVPALFLAGERADPDTIKYVNMQ